MSDLFGTRGTVSCGRCGRAGVVRFLRADDCCESFPDGWFVWRYGGRELCAREDGCPGHMVALLCSEECVLAWKERLDQERAADEASRRSIEEALKEAGELLGAVAHGVTNFFRSKR